MLLVLFLLNSFNSSVQLLVKQLHLLFMLHLEILYLLKTFLFKISELLLPLVIELLQFLIANLNVLCELSILDI